MVEKDIITTTSESKKSDESTDMNAVYSDADGTADSFESEKTAAAKDIVSQMSPEDRAYYEAIKEKIRQKKLVELRLQRYYASRDKAAHLKQLELEKNKRSKFHKYVCFGIFALFVIICFILYYTKRDSYDALNDQAGMLFKNYQSESYFKYGNSMLFKIEKPSNFNSYVSSEHTEEIDFVRHHSGKTGNLTQAVFSPDRQYILFSTVVYNYDGSDPENDEYCFYYVMDVNTGKPSLLFKGFRQWYEIDWR